MTVNLYQTLIIEISIQAIINQIKAREAPLTRCVHVFVMEQSNDDGMAAGQTCALLLITCSQEESWNSLEMSSPHESPEETETAASA